VLGAGLKNLPNINIVPKPAEQLPTGHVSQYCRAFANLWPRDGRARWIVQAPVMQRASMAGSNAMPRGSPDPSAHQGFRYPTKNASYLVFFCRRPVAYADGAAPESPSD
jgi:hypothetical protein